RTTANWGMPGGTADDLGGPPPSDFGVELPSSITSGGRKRIFLPPGALPPGPPLAPPPSPSTISGGYRRTVGPPPGFQSWPGSSWLGSRLLLCDGTGAGGIGGSGKG